MRNEVDFTGVAGECVSLGSASCLTPLLPHTYDGAGVNDRKKMLSPI